MSGRHNYPTPNIFKAQLVRAAAQERQDTLLKNRAMKTETPGKGVDIREFSWGVTFDDTGDHGPLLQDALDEVDSVFVPAGTLRIETPFIPPWGRVLHGEGRQTVIHLVQDMGPDEFAIGIPPGFPAEIKTGFENLRLQGPAFGTGDWGTPPIAQDTGEPVEMDGICLGPTVYVDNVAVSGFRSGLVQWGDHTRVWNSEIGGCYYAMYWKANPPSQGDQFIQNTQLGAGNMASIAVNGDPTGGNYPGGLVALDVHLGYGPYGIIKEPGDAAFMVGCEFIDCPFESCSNAYIKDFSPKTGNCLMSRVFFRQWASSGLTPAFEIPDAGHEPNWLFDVDVIEDCLFEGFQQWSTADVGIFNFNRMSRVKICQTASMWGLDFSSTVLTRGFHDRICIEDGDDIHSVWKTSENVSGGELFELTAADTGRKHTNTSYAVVGAVRHPADANDGVAVVVQGNADILTTGSISTGQYVKVDTANPTKVVAATSFSDGNVVGSAIASTSGGKTRIRLRGLV